MQYHTPSFRFGSMYWCSPLGMALPPSYSTLHVYSSPLRQRPHHVALFLIILAARSLTCDSAVHLWLAMQCCLHAMRVA